MNKFTVHPEISQTRCK